MKGILDKIGYILIIVGFFAILYKYGSYLLFETSYLINGRVEQLDIVSKEKVNGKNVYYFKLDNEAKETYTSLPTKKEYLENGKVKVRTVPLFNKVLIGNFTLGSYVVGIALLVFGLAVATLSFWMIIGIQNKYTARIKYANK
jgi:hypothetical protein